MVGVTRTQSKPFLVCFAVVFILGLSLVIASNYWADPANIFHAKYAVAQRAAEILASGQNLGMAKNMDDRLVQREYVRRVRQLPNAIAIGSSRSREISAEIAPPNMRFFNHGVNGAGMEDAVAVLGLYLQQNQLPDLVIWSVDPWIFNARHADSRWRSLTKSYRHAAEKIGLDTKRESPIDRLWNAWQRAGLLLRLDSAVGFVKAILSGRTLDHMLEQKVQAVDGKTWNKLLVYSDGSFRWGPAILRRTAEEVGRYGNEAAEKRLLSSINDFEQLDARALRAFEKVVKFLQSSGVKLVIFLPPYQPDAYVVFERRGRPRGVFLTEAWLRALAERRGVLLAGSYDPKRAGCGRGDFVDAHHPRRVCVNRLLRRVTAAFGR